MFPNPSLITRIAVGKLFGLAVGVIGFVVLPMIWPAVPATLQWGVLLWYVTLGALIGIFGVFEWHPILRMPMPWWFRGALLGGWMNFVLTLFAADQMQAVLTAMFGADGLVQSPWWFVLEGVIFGLACSWLTTRFGGEGIAAAEAAAMPRAAGQHRT